MECVYPKRKENRLKYYSYSEIGFYFITICARNKDKLFGTFVGGGALDAPHIRLSDTGNILRRYIESTDRILGVSVDHYVIMPNHFHMIVIISEQAEKQAKNRANEMIPHVVGTMKRFVNRDVGENVFQRGYHDHVIRGKQDYLKIWNYIDTNPQRWEKDCFFVE